MPEWTEPVARYVIEQGLVNTLKLSAIALVGSALIGITLGTLLTIRFLPMRAVIRLYIEVWRGLPILVTIFIIFFALPAISDSFRFDALTAGAIGLILWGSAQVAEATRGAVGSIPREQHEAASALGFGWVGRHAFVILPQALRRLLPPHRRPARQHHPEHDDRPGHRRAGAAGVGRAPGRATHVRGRASTRSRSTAR